LTSEQNYWKAESINWKTICELFEKNKEKVAFFDTTEEIRTGLTDAFDEFRKIND